MRPIRRNGQYRLPGFISRHFIEGLLGTPPRPLDPNCRDSSPGTSLRDATERHDPARIHDCRDSSPGTSLRDVVAVVTSAVPIVLPGFISRHFIEGGADRRTRKMERNCRDSSPGTSLRGATTLRRWARICRLPGFISRHFIEGRGYTVACSDRRGTLPGFISRHFIEGAY